MGMGGRADYARGIMHMAALGFFGLGSPIVCKRAVD